MANVDVKQRHPRYEAHCKKWVRQRDVVDGEDRVKEQGITYLPMLEGQMSNQLMDSKVPAASGMPVFTSYEAYKARGTMINLTKRTRDGLVGAILRKDAAITWPESQATVLESIGRCLETFYEIQNETLKEVTGIGRYGLLADMPAGEGGEPFVASYQAEHITDWEQGLVSGRRVPIRINLWEKRWATVAGERREVERYRVLRLGVPGFDSPAEQTKFVGDNQVSFEEVEAGPIYYVEIYDEVLKHSESGDEYKDFVRTSILVPKMAGGKVWRQIPFQFFNADDTNVDPETPLLEEITLIDLGIYRLSTDLEHGLHFTALPQPWVAGFKFSGSLYIGSAVAWVAEDPEAHAGYLEFQGTGLAAIERRIETRKKEAAALGARLLEEQPKPGGNESFETVKLRHSGERSVLANCAIAVSEGLTRILQFLAMFRGMPDVEKISIALNLDFGTEGMSSQMLLALMEQVQAGHMSWESYFWNVKKGDLIPDQTTQEQERAQIKKGAPPPPPPPPKPIDPNPGKAAPVA